MPKNYLGLSYNKKKLAFFALYSIHPIYYSTLINLIYQMNRLNNELNTNIEFDKCLSSKELNTLLLEENILSFYIVNLLLKNLFFIDLIEQVKLLKKLLLKRNQKIFVLTVINEKDFFELVLVNNYIKTFIELYSKTLKQTKEESKEKVIYLSLKALILLEKFLIQN